MARSSRTQKRRGIFLRTLEEMANVSEACRRSGMPRRTAYDWRKDDAAFAEEWNAAMERGTDALEDEAIRRAAEGTLRPVFYRGQECGSVRGYSDSLLMFMLKARRPEKFKDRSERQHVGTGGGPIQHTAVSKEDLAEAIERVRDKF